MPTSGTYNGLKKYNDKNKSCPVLTDPPMRPCVLWCLVHAKYFYAIVVFSFYIEQDV